MKPNLSATCDDLSALAYPVLASPKLDGIRVLIIDGKVYSRNMKLIPNAFVQAELKGISQHLDGEIIVGDPKADDCYRKTNSGVMSRDGEPDFTFWIFDNFAMPDGFKDRLASIKEYVKASKRPRLRVVPHVLKKNVEELAEYEAQHLSAGYEGIMVRGPYSLYKEGRSTLREGGLAKIKRFLDSEAVILGFDEQQHNGNVATKDELGRTKRSSHKAGKTGKGVMGALKVRDVYSGVEFDVGTGFSDAERADIWGNRESYAGKTIKYKFLPVGVKDKPRHPVYLGLRSDL